MKLRPPFRRICLLALHAEELPANMTWLNGLNWFHDWKFELIKAFKFKLNPVLSLYVSSLLCRLLFCNVSNTSKDSVGWIQGKCRSVRSSVCSRRTTSYIVVQPVNMYSRKWSTKPVVTASSWAHYLPDLFIASHTPSLLCGFVVPVQRIVQTRIKMHFCTVSPPRHLWCCT